MIELLTMLCLWTAVSVGAGADQPNQLARLQRELEAVRHEAESVRVERDELKEQNDEVCSWYYNYNNNTIILVVHIVHRQYSILTRQSEAGWSWKKNAWSSNKEFGFECEGS